MLWKASVLSPGWLDYVPLSEAKFLWQQMLPEAPALLSRLRWTMLPDGSELSRRDTVQGDFGFLGRVLMVFLLSL